MKKQFISVFCLLVSNILAFAGDAAAFVDIGFSSDSKTYVFGEYGKTDRSFQAYAEIYTVNVERNDFVPGEVFKNRPSEETTGFSGKEMFEALSRKSAWKLEKYECKPVAPENILYVRTADGKDEKDEISFKDFESSTLENEITYYVKLVPLYEGNGINSHSSFFISLEQKDAKGNVVSKNIVGSPDIKRKGVVGYKINKIFTDHSGKNMVFVVEKTIADSTGFSIRYMVETVHL